MYQNILIQKKSPFLDIFEYQSCENFFDVSGKIQVHFSCIVSGVMMKIAMCYGQLHIQWIVSINLYFLNTSGYRFEPDKCDTIGGPLKMWPH